MEKNSKFGNLFLYVFVMLAIILVGCAPAPEPVDSGGGPVDTGTIQLGSPESLPSDIPSQLAWGGMGGGEGGDESTKSEQTKFVFPGFQPNEPVRILIFDEPEKGKGLNFIAERRDQANGNGVVTVTISKAGHDYTLHVIVAGETTMASRQSEWGNNIPGVEYFDEEKLEGVPAFLP